MKNAGVNAPNTAVKPQNGPLSREAVHGSRPCKEKGLTGYEPLSHVEEYRLYLKYREVIRSVTTGMYLDTWNRLFAWDDIYVTVGAEAWKLIEIWEYPLWSTAWRNPMGKAKVMLRNSARTAFQAELRSRGWHRVDGKWQPPAREQNFDFSHPRAERFLFHNQDRTVEDYGPYVTKLPIRKRTPEDRQSDYFAPWLWLKYEGKL